MNFNKIIITLIITLSQLSANLFSDTLDKANKLAQDDLKSSLEKLSSLRNDISKEKVPLLKKINELEVKVKNQQSKVDRQLRLRDNSDMSLERLQNQVEAAKKQNSYFTSILENFVEQFSSSIDYSETQIYGDLINEAQDLAFNSAMVEDNSETFKNQIKVIEAAINRLKKLTGGYSYQGKALAEDGSIVDGTYSIFGPQVYFKSDDNSVQGIADMELNAATSSIKNPGNKFLSSINSYIETGIGNLPVDGSDGNALKVEASNETLYEHLQKGGAVGLAIILIGIACLGIGIIKYLEITRFVTPRRDQVQNILTQLQNNKKEEALSIASKASGEAGELLKIAVENFQTKRGNLEELLYEKILTSQPKLERYLPFMALTAAAAPLMGLLGTVTGMINTFSLITIFGTGDAKSLSSGISEALVTTELGLIVAIPSLILHGLLSRMAKQKISDLDNASVSFINGVSNFKD